MPEEWVKELRKLHDNGCTDSDIEDFCTQYNVPQDIAFHHIEEWNAPDCCKGCKYLFCYNSAYPCTVCSRNKKDMYATKEP